VLAPTLDERLARRWTAERPVMAGLALIAREAAELLSGADRARIRECAAAPACSRLYVDRSRAYRRRWCQMEWCGSQAKMDAYRRRVKSSAQSQGHRSA
jgi:predicted RNA-binding Zn ribbon-like protein